MKNKTIEISLEEYQRLHEEIKLLKDNDLLQKMNTLVDILYRDKNNLYMGDYTEDLTEVSINNSWDKHSKSAWDEV